MDEDNYLLAKEGQKKRDPMEIALKLRASKPKIQAASTLKFQALFEKRKQEAEEKQRKIAEVKREEEERVYKQQRVKNKKKFY